MKKEGVKQKRKLISYGTQRRNTFQLQTLSSFKDKSVLDLSGILNFSNFQGNCQSDIVNEKVFCGDTESQNFMVLPLKPIF